MHSQSVENFGDINLATAYLEIATYLINQFAVMKF